MIQDETGARLVGINPSFVRTVIFALSGALAGIVAITHSMSGPLTVNAGFELTTFALIVTVVGGLGSVAGAFLAGVLLGIVNTLSAHYIGQYITSVILLGAAALTHPHPTPRAARAVRRWRSRRRRVAAPAALAGSVGRAVAARSSPRRRFSRSSRRSGSGTRRYTTSLAVQALVFAVVRVSAST